MSTISSEAMCIATESYDSLIQDYARYFETHEKYLKGKNVNKLILRKIKKELLEDGFDEDEVYVILSKQFKNNPKATYKFIYYKTVLLSSLNSDELDNRVDLKRNIAQIWHRNIEDEELEQILGTRFYLNV